MHRFLPLGMAGALFLTGCATITDDRQTVTVQTDPGGAEVALTTGETGITPVVFHKNRQEDFTLRITKEGYKSFSIRVKSKLAASGPVLFPSRIQVRLVRTGEVIQSYVDELNPEAAGEAVPVADTGGQRRSFAKQKPVRPSRPAKPPVAPPGTRVDANGTVYLIGE